MRTRNYMVSVLVLLGLGSATVSVPPGGPKANRDSLAFAFAFTDLEGKKAILFDSPDVPIPREMFAVSSSGELLSFQRLRKQKASPTNTDRYTAPNFNKLPGWVFQSNQAGNPGKTILLVSASFLKSHTIVPIHSEQWAPLDSITKRRIESTRGLKINRSWVFASFAHDGRIAIVRFFPGRDTVLASLVLFQNEKLVFEDFAGNARDDETTWRVDDGGVISPDEFSIIAAFDSSGSLKLARTWAGTEGENDAFLGERGSIFSVIDEAYRYWVPE
jgi:hypothetical protein